MARGPFEPSCLAFTGSPCDRGAEGNEDRACGLYSITFAKEFGRRNLPSTVIAALTEAAVLTDPNGVVTSWNDASESLLGWTAAELVGRPLVERFPAAARARITEQLQRLSAGGEWDGVFEDYRKDGSRFWAEVHMRPVRSVTGAITGILGVWRPTSSAPPGVTFESSADPYAADILNSMSAHVAVLGPDARIREVNRAWTRFAVENTPGGLSPASTEIGVDYVDLCRGCTGEKSEEANLAADGIEAVLRGERPFFGLEYPCDSPSETRWFAMHVTPLTRAAGAVVAHYDITARKQAELAVAAQTRKTELALSAANMGVWTLDLPAGCITWSAEIYKIVGVTEFDGCMESWNRFIHPDDRAHVQTRLTDAVERRMPFATEFRIVRPSGEVRWLESLAHVECSPSGEVASVVSAIQDVTARKRSAWALTAYNRILEMIAAGAGLHTILDEVVRLVEEQIPGSLCSVLIVDKATNCLRFGAGGSLPAEYNRAVDGVPIGPKAGSCGTAAFRKAFVTVTDIATDPLWEDYREIALRHGLRSCVSVPIFSSGNVPGREKGEVIGTFALYGHAPGEFDRVAYAILAGAELLVRRAVQAGQKETPTAEDSAQVVEAAHLAGVAIERDQAEHAIRESEERFRTVIDTAPLAVYIKDRDGHYVFVNRSTSEMFDVPPARWIGKRARELLPAHVAELSEASDRLVLASQDPVHEKYALKLRDGREASVLATHMLLRNKHGAYGICGILLDITDLAVAQGELELLWLHAPEPLCVAGYDGYFKRLNPAWSVRLGWSEAELRAQPIASFLHPGDVPAMVEAMRELIAGRSVRRVVNRFRCKDGRYKWFSWDAISLPAQQAIYGFVRDVTEERRLEEQFRQSQKMEAVGQLASGVAHDFNNLLCVINGYVEMMLGDNVTSEQHELLSEVLEAGKRAAGLTSQLLAFSRKAIVEPKVLDVNHVIESAVRMLRRLIGEDVKLTTQLGAVATVKIDPGQLEQVFMNLAVNARDAMPAGGRLSITTETVDLDDGSATEPAELNPGRYVRISITDTGSGMSPDVMARIFDPFFTTKGPGKGTGLGLATVYGIVRQASGAITVESALGAGTTFRILLPCVREAAAPTTSAVIDQAPRGTETVLIAEDEKGVRDVAAAMLRKLGYTVIVSDTAANAERIAMEHPGRIDLLLTDVVMPDMDGRALAELVRDRRPGVRVLFMSGYTDDAIIRSGIETSRDWFIQKPFTSLALARRVRSVLDRPGLSAS